MRINIFKNTLIVKEFNFFSMKRLIFRTGLNFIKSFDFNSQKFMNEVELVCPILIINETLNTLATGSDIVMDLGLGSSDK